MKIATVVGPLAPGRCLGGFDSVRWIQVRADGELLVAADLVGAAPGQPVLLATGAAAGHYRMDLCTDALVVAVLEE